VSNQLRAEVHLGRNEVAVATRQLERRWSKFLGQSTALRDHTINVDWMTADAPEVDLRADGAPIGPIDLGYIEWSEMLTPEGPALVQTRSGTGGLIARIETIALHTGPLLRRWRITNARATHVTLTDLIVEALPLRGRIEMPDAWPSVLLARSKAAPALALGGPGLRAEHVDGRARLIAPGPVQLAPGDSADLPPAWLAPFAGPPQEALLRISSTLQAALDRIQHWESEQNARAQREDQGKNTDAGQ